MGKKIKPTPEKYCEECGSKLERKRLPNGDLEYFWQFTRRKFCGRVCMALNFNKRESTGRSYSAGHYNARKKVKNTICDQCGNKASHIHHKDGDFLNNNMENLESLCVSCHVKKHGKRPPVNKHGENIKPVTIKDTARKLKKQLENIGCVEWSYDRWKYWSLSEIEQVATQAKISFKCEGPGSKLVWLSECIHSDDALDLVGFGSG